MPKISVIVPVFNIEKYLRCCIDSILAQTFSDFELLLINDGSTDSSGKICDGYALQDSRIRVFHQMNEGVTSARRLGVNNAQGEWITFVDSDDYVVETYLEVFVRHIKLGDKLLCCSNDCRIVSSKDFINDLLYNKQAWSMMMKFYLSEQLKNRDFFNCPRHINIGEDLIANILISKNITRIRYLQNEGYIIREHDESVTKSRNWSLDYAVKFLTYIHNLIGENEVFADALWLLRLRGVKNLLLNGVVVSRSHSLYQSIIKNVHSIPLGLGDHIVLKCPFPKLTGLVLKLLNMIK